MSNILPEDALATWGAKVANSPEYTNASPQDKLQAEHDYFTHYIAPKVPAEKQSDALTQWAFATTPPNQYYTNPNFLKMDDGQKRSILRSSVLASGQNPDEVTATTGNQTIGFVDEGGAGMPSQTTKMDEAYSKFQNDPAVQQLQDKANAASLGGPAVEVAEKATKGVNAVAGIFNMHSDYADKVAGRLDQTIANKNELQAEFPSSATREGLEKGLILGGAGGKIAEGMSAIAPTTNVVSAAGPILPEAASTASRAANFTGNVVGNTAAGLTLKQGDVNSENASNALVVNTAAQAAFPVLGALKSMFGGVFSSKQAVLDNINVASDKVAKAFGISSKQAKQDLINDLAVAPTNELTPAGVNSTAAGLSETAPQSTALLNEVTKGAPNKKNLVAASTADKAADIQNTIEDATVPYANDLNSITPPGAALATRLAKPLYVDATKIANNMPVGSASELTSLATNAKHYETGAPLNSVEQEALAKSPTIQAVAEQAKDEATATAAATTTTPEYAATVKQYGQSTADTLVKQGQLQQFVPHLPNYTIPPMTATELKQRIGQLNDEISANPTSTDAHALISVKKQWQAKLDDAYQQNPALQHAVETADTVHKVDKTINVFEDMASTLDPTNSITSSTGVFQKNIDPTAVSAFLKKYGTDEAIASAKELMTPPNFTRYQDIVEQGRALERQGLVSDSGGGEDSAVGKATTGVLKQFTKLKYGATGDFLNSIKIALNKNYGEALNTVLADPQKASELVNAAMKQKDATAALQQQYKAFVQPLLGPIANELLPQGPAPTMTPNQPLTTPKQPATIDVGPQSSNEATPEHPAITAFGADGQKLIDAHPHVKAYRLVSQDTLKNDPEAFFNTVTKNNKTKKLTLSDPKTVAQVLHETQEAA